RIRPRPVRRAPGIALASGRAPVTTALVAINVLIYLIGASQGAGFNNPGGALYEKLWLDAPDLHQGGWWRLVTTMFLHASIVHIAFNMWALWVIGRIVEQYLGTVRYIGLYFVSGLAGSAGALVQTQGVTVGASGAIFGILGAMIILEWQVTGRLAGQAMALAGINLVISILIPGISWGGHVGGLIGGILIMLGYAHWRDGRAQYGQIGGPGIVGLIAVAAASVAIAYLRVRGQV
ncbi:MAG TPA: rhomboid family intramembrane serine protease, partial [Gaiellaceae bacterium]|nr:rhomboid family intramembrane serine protease [Gaiellaceae bacterium]